MQVDIFPFKRYLEELQADMCQQLESLEPSARFLKDAWKRSEGGGGLTCVMQGGEVFESAGVNFSYVYGDTLPKSATANRPELAGRSFQALGVSSVIHPKNPYVPTSHMNVRLFAAQNDKDSIAWFGGGFDLTPYYPFKDDCIYWHKVAKSVCDPFGKEVYPKYKTWADEYFYLHHRHEPRGIGGLFFDDLNEQTWGWDFDRSMAFTKSVGRAFLRAYLPIVRRRHVMGYSEQERRFQSLRRGRYVEFNLLYDRGTLFGIQSGGRTESILMSLPPSVSWQYNFHPADESKEARLFNEFLIPTDWANQEPEENYLVETA